MAKPKKKVVSRTQKGGLSVPKVKEKDLPLAELRERVLGELDALAGMDRAGVRPYKMVLVVKRSRKSALSYKLVVERSE